MASAISPGTWMFGILAGEYSLLLLLSLRGFCSGRLTAYFLILFLSSALRAYSFFSELFALFDVASSLFLITVGDWVFIQVFFALGFYWSAFFFAIRGTYRRKHKIYFFAVYAVWVVVYLSIFLPHAFPYKNHGWLNPSVRASTSWFLTAVYIFFATASLPLTLGVYKQLMQQSLPDLARQVTALATSSGVLMTAHAATFHMVAHALVEMATAGSPDGGGGGLLAGVTTEEAVGLVAYYTLAEVAPVLLLERAVMMAYTSADACTTRTVPGYAGFLADSSINSPLTGGTAAYDEIFHW